MTESEWLACVVPSQMVNYLSDESKATIRKLHLYVAACHRINWGFFDKHCPLYKTLTTAEERFADGLAKDSELLDVLREIGIDGIENENNIDDHYSWAVGYPNDSAKDGAYWIAGDDEPEQWDVEFEKIEKTQCNILREIFGNPFRPSAADPSWITTPVLHLAESFYSSRSFDGLPVLADALRDAGCDDVAVLDHCSKASAHVRGCWVVDLLLGRT